MVNGTNTFKIVLPRLRGARQASSEQSLPGPDSGGRRSDMMCRLLHDCTRFSEAAGNKSPADVRVGEVDGQPSPGAHQARPLQLDIIANHFGQIHQFETPQGNQLHASYRSRRATHHYMAGIIIVKKNQPRKAPVYRIPPAVLAGTLILLLVLVNLPPVGPCTGIQWRVLRLFKGVYRRRRLKSHKPTALRTSQNPATRKPTAGRPQASTVLILLALLGTLQVAGAVTSPQPARRSIYTQHAQGLSTLDSRKTSFQRAQRRALNTGFAFYRGRHMTAKQLGVVWTSPTRTRSVKARPQQTRKPRIRFVTWNAGGLNLSRQSELRTWLEEESQTNPVHVLCIQETHWPESREYRDGAWTCIHSGSGSREGGVLIMLHASFFQGVSVKHAEVEPGRLLHVRLEGNPSIDILGVYQHAWNPAKVEYQHQAQSPEQMLMHKRQGIWRQLQGWVSSIPKRNQMVLLGDFNASLQPQLPNIGLGVGPTHLHKKDSQSLQSLVCHAGLNVVNSWSRPGQSASTFWTHRGEGSQIDFIIVRNPCNISEIKAAPLHKSPLVHPTGFRHVPVHCYLQWPKPPQQRKHDATMTAHRVNQICNGSPHVVEAFRERLQQMHCTAEELDSQLSEAWSQCQPAPVTLPLIRDESTRVCLKSYWVAKNNLRRISIEEVTSYILADASQQIPTSRLSRTSIEHMHRLLSAWHAAARFQKLNKQLRDRSRAAKQDKINKQIGEAIAADRKGLTYLYKCMNTLRPKQPKRSIHIKSPEGKLQSNSEELGTIKAYFSQIFSSNEPPVLPQWHLQASLDITKEELQTALASLSSKKALPPGQAPARLWKEGQDIIVQALHNDFQHRFSAGEIVMPSGWHSSHVALLPKPGKPPTSPSNLRSISLLPAIPKLLARIAAHRLRPYLLAAVEYIPQFAYLSNRQTSDSLDRVLTHCQQVRNKVSANRFNPFSTQNRIKFTGGMQLSLDLAKAFDRMPRHLLLMALERISLPEDLISLILYIHDNAVMRFQRGEEEVLVRAGSGIRQGCRLAPLLWASFTILIFDKFTHYLSLNQITGFADDLHVKWDIDEPRHFRNACAQVGYVISDLREMGMQVSTDKTVILLALAGQAYNKITGPYIQKRKKDRYLKIVISTGPTQLPIKTSHKYLGVVISYQHFERLSMQYRLQQSWQAFHRLSSFLCSKKIPLNKRLQLWKTCVQSIARYGLDSVGLDEVSANKYRSHVARQLRIISGSLGHLTHETNAALHRRLSVPDPVAALLELIQRRIRNSRQHLSHLQPSSVQQRLTYLLSEVSLFTQPTQQPQGELTEVTQVVRIACSCDQCGQQFASFHALRTHIGKSHPEQSIALTKSAYSVRSARSDSHMMHARRGKPQCDACGKQFSNWPAFMSHFNHWACPILHTQSMRSRVPTEVDSPLADGAFAPEGATESTSGSYVPIFKQLRTQDVAQTGSVSQICKHIRDKGLADRCPECGMSCKPMYISRRACKQHAWIREANAQVIQWVRNCQVPTKPCQWCGTQYATTNKAHRNACPVLWMCGHLLNKFSTLKPPGQLALNGYDWSRRADKGLGGAGVLPKLHGSSGLSDSCSQPGLNGGTGGDACGYELKEEWCGPRLPESGCEMAQEPRQGIQQAERQQRPPEVLVGKGQASEIPRSGLRSSWGGQGPRPPSPSPRGLPCGDAARLPVHYLHAESDQELGGQCPRVERYSTALFGRLPLAGPKGQEPAVAAAAAEDSFVQLMADSDSVPHRGDPDQAGGQGSGNPHGVAGKRLLPLPRLVSGGGQAQEGSTGSNVHGGNPAGGGTAAAANYSPQRNRQVSSSAQADSRHAERRNSMDFGNPKQDAGVPDDLPTGRKVDPQRQHSPGSFLSTALQARQIPTSHGGGQTTSGAVRPGTGILQLQLLNPHEHSYANSIVMSVLWLAACMPEGLSVPHPGLSRFLQWLSNQQKPQPLWSILTWQTTMQGWKRPLHRHDPALFLQFLHDKFTDRSQAGEWCKFAIDSSSPNSVQVLASGHSWPIPLTVALDPEQPNSLQDLINRWHQPEPAQVCGLSSLPPVLALQLQRYNAEGKLLKGKLIGPWQVDMPCYTVAGGEVVKHPYRAHAITFSTGADVLQSCHRVALLQDGELVYVTTDGKRSSKIKSADKAAALQHGYLIFLGRCSTS